jgi:hypothetical protein
MDHTYIEEHHIADRYVTGSLDPAEAELFEDHYLSCPQCLDRLETAETMKRGFERVAAEEAAERSAVSQLALVAWLSRLGRQRQLALLSMVVVLLLLPAGLSFYGFAARDRALAEARSARSSQDRLESDLKANQRAVAVLRAARAREEEQLALAQAPQGTILYLDQVRGGGGVPAKQLRQPKPGIRIVFSWALDPPFYPAYQARLTDREGHKLWQGPVPGPPEQENPILIQPVALLPGDYTLLVEGQGSGGKWTAAGQFSFRILPPA